jgi:hypothetical protein
MFPHDRQQMGSPCWPTSPGFSPSRLRNCERIFRIRISGERGLPRRSYLNHGCPRPSARVERKSSDTFDGMRGANRVERDVDSAVVDVVALAIEAIDAVPEARSHEDVLTAAIRIRLSSDIECRTRWPRSRPSGASGTMRSAAAMLWRAGRRRGPALLHAVERTPHARAPFSSSRLRNFEKIHGVSPHSPGGTRLGGVRAFYAWRIDS